MSKMIELLGYSRLKDRYNFYVYGDSVPHYYIKKQLMKDYLRIMIFERVNLFMIKN
jgi:hypothetical protein